MKILFITSNRVGDAVLSTGVLSALVEQYPHADITIVCGSYAASLFRAVPNLERLIVLKKRKYNRHWLSFWLKCIGTRWDLIVDLRNSAAARMLRGKKYLHRAGSTGQHKVIENGIVLGLSLPPAPRLWLDDAARKNAARILPPALPLIALAPAANWAPKQWPAENFVKLAQRLGEPNGLFPDAQFIVIADKHETAPVEIICKKLGIEKAHAILGEDLLTIAACLESASLFVGNDSGLMHMAAAMQVPTLGLFGPGQEHIYGPWGGHTVRTPESRDELWKRLPSPHATAPNLMETLSVDAVYKTISDMLENKEKT